MGTRSILQCVTITIQLVDLCSRLRIISPLSSLLHSLGVQVRQPLRSKRFRGQVSKERRERGQPTDNGRERERRRKERRMREAEGEAGSASAGRKAALMYLIQTRSKIRWSWYAVSS